MKVFQFSQFEETLSKIQMPRHSRLERESGTPAAGATRLFVFSLSIFWMPAYAGSPAAGMTYFCSEVRCMKSALKETLLKIQMPRDSRLERESGTPTAGSPAAGMTYFCSEVRCMKSALKEAFSKGHAQE